MTPGEVGALLQSFGCFRWESGPHGFTLPGNQQRWPGNLGDGSRPVRIERGSGIAGRGGHWGLVDIRTGESTPRVSTRRELRRLILEWLAGPKPHVPDGFTCYAKHNHNRFGDAYIWVIRRPR